MRTKRGETVSSLLESLFDCHPVRVSVIYAGTLCGPRQALSQYPGGCFHFVRAGQADLLVSDETPIRITQPSLVFSARPRLHTLQPLSDDGVQMVCAAMECDDTITRLTTLAFPSVVVVPLREFSSINHTVEAFFAEALSPQPRGKYLESSLCVAVLVQLIRQALEDGSPSAGLAAGAVDPKIAAALHLIHDRYHDPLDLDRLTEAAGMSRSRFVARFTSLMGLSPHQYLTRYRMTMAENFLVAQQPVKVVADRVGYQTVPAFVRKFKEVKGLSPAAWARQRKALHQETN
jgi:AraC-like DNA-binding protein